MDYQEGDVRSIVGNNFVQKIESIDSWIHPSFRVSFSDGHSVFLRFSARRKNVHFRGDDYNFDKDIHVSDLLLANTDVKVPKIFHRGRYNNTEFLIIEDMGGVNLAEFCNRDIKSAPSQVIRDWGSLMAKVHSIKSDDFGYIGMGGIARKFDRWSDVVEEYLEMTLDSDIISDDERKGVRNLFSRFRDELDSGRDPRLVLYNTHGDNLIVRDGKLIGISDVMLAFFGDRSLDFMFPYYFGVGDSFREGYVESGGTVPINIDILNKINVMNYYLSTVLNYRDATDRRRLSWSEDYRKKLRLLLEENKAI